MMQNNQNIKLRLLSYAVIAYMLLAFMWWSVLLFNKNNDTFQAKSQLLNIGLVADGLVSSQEEFQAHPDYLELKKSYRRQEWMIMGEGIVFIITLIIGIWLINRGYNKEVVSARQRRNFLLSITHELKSPIASIRLVLETFIKRELKPEMRQKLTSNALKETERLNTLVNDLLLSAKLDTSYQPNFEPLFLNDLIAQLIEKLETKYPTAKLVYNIEGDIPALEADHTGMTSVCLNLLENAIKYSPEIPQIVTTLSNKGNKLELTIADKGMGINNKEKKKIFERFYRIGNEDTRKTKGTGLGLYIVQQIVEAHFGKIKVMDNHPKGSIFHITLPIKKV